MQSFWFFVPIKELGGKALQIKNIKKLLFFFPQQKEPKSAYKRIMLNYSNYILYVR